MANRHRLLTALVAVLAGSVGWSPVANGQTKPKAQRLNLAQIIEKARKNPVLRAARAATASASARASEASAARLGIINVTGFLGPSPEIECTNAECTTTSVDQATVALAGVFTGARLQFVQPLYTFGKLSAVRSGARQLVSVARAQQQRVAESLNAQAARAYYGFKLARELVWMLEDGRDQIVKAIKKVDTLIDKGTGDVTLQDRMRLGTLLAEVKTRSIDAVAARRTALAGIAALVGDRNIDVDQDPLEPVTFALQKDPARYLSRLRSHDVRLRMARAGLEAMRAQHRIERSKLLPDLLLVAGLSTAYAQGVDNPPSAFANDPYNGTGASLGLVLRWKLQPLRSRARLRRTRADTRRAAATLEAAEMGARFSLNRAHIRASQAQKRLLAARGGEKAAKGWVASVAQAEAVGAIAPKDTADALVAFFKARAMVLESILAWNLAVTDLQRAIGEYPGQQTVGNHKHAHAAPSLRSGLRGLGRSLEHR